MEKVATDIYTFARLREDGFTYVDKTDALYAMASGETGVQFFIARPRRFGKSLAVSTLKSLFEGRRELFAGLAIEPKWDWSKKWPVLHLDMGSMQARDVDEFRELLMDHLSDRVRELGVEGLSGSSPAVVFKRLIDALAAKSPDGRMVLLVDEYDKPLLGHLMKPDVTEFRDALKAFYSDARVQAALRVRHGRVEVLKGFDFLRPQQPQRLDDGCQCGDALRLHA